MNFYPINSYHLTANLEECSYGVIKGLGEFWGGYYLHPTKFKGGYISTKSLKVEYSFGEMDSMTLKEDFKLSSIEAAIKLCERHYKLLVLT